MELKERLINSQKYQTGTTTYVKHSNKWYKLLEFTNGTLGIKIKGSKAFNPYIIFEGEDLKSVHTYLAAKKLKQNKL